MRVCFLSFCGAIVLTLIGQTPAFAELVLQTSGSSVTQTFSQTNTSAFGPVTLAQPTLQKSSCTEKDVAGGGDPGPSFECSLYPTSDGVTLNDIVQGIQFPNTTHDHPSNDPVSPGYVVLVKAGSTLDSNSQDANRADWTQVLQFVDNGLGQATSMNLYTLGCNNTSNPSDFSCFPTFATVNNDANIFDFEPANGVYVYSPGDQRQHKYTMNFVAETGAPSVPEPKSITLFALGLVGVLCFNARFRNTAKQ